MYRRLIITRDVYRAIAATLAILILPAAANLFVDGARWGAFDYIIAGCILLVTQLVTVAVIRLPVSKNKRYVLIGGVLLFSAAVWVDLAVGIFD